jgi:hypothetical protein
LFFIKDFLVNNINNSGRMILAQAPSKRMSCLPRWVSLGASPSRCYADRAGTVLPTPGPLIERSFLQEETDSGIEKLKSAL